MHKIACFMPKKKKRKKRKEKGCSCLSVCPSVMHNVFTNENNTFRGCRYMKFGIMIGGGTVNAHSLIILQNIILTEIISI